MHDSRPRIDPALSLARNRMESVANIHSVYLAIVSGDETKVIEFAGDDLRRTMLESLPAVIRDIKALGLIVSSPDLRPGKCGAVVTLVDRTIEAFYAPILNFTNADTMIGDFRPSDITRPDLYERIHAELRANWISHGDD